jgi:hypothetical protein
VNTDISTWGSTPPAPISPATRIHSAQIRRVVEDTVYQFVLPGFDGGRSIFGPALGPPGLLAGGEAYALPTIDGEWVLYDPLALGAGGGGIEEETDPVASPALAAHESDTTGVHGIANTALLIVEGDTRLSDARVPLAHAASHATGGTDPVTPAAIGAATTAALAAHESDTTVVHGIADTSALVLTSDARLSDQRVPTDLSVTNAKVAAGAAIARSKLDFGSGLVNGDIDAAAGIAATKIAGTALTLAGGTLTGPLLVPVGSAGAPGLAIAGDPNTGLYWGGTDALILGTGGAGRLTVANSGISVNGTQSIIFTTTAALTNLLFLANGATDVARPNDFLILAYSGWGSSNDVEFYVTNGGVVRADGTIVGGGADYAEWFEHDAPMKPGDVVGLNIASGKVRKYVSGDPLVGVVSERPAFAAAPPTPMIQPDANTPPPATSPTHTLVGLIGQVYVDPTQIVTDKRSVLTTSDRKRIGFRLANGNVFISALGIVSLPGAA